MGSRDVTIESSAAATLAGIGNQDSKLEIEPGHGIWDSDSLISRQNTH